ncbi:cryptochrome/photolyase family protein [Micromonospora echinofusca]|uniref:Cryptochrome/photolyase family protein n=1 Tax=Micromonospora echinofusca TaxID=47858 RepID=A0ABS3VMX0_MICEH|nr:cryptochrome/photolyase family protein [Micromonospora echinofusca]MBO4205899.1 cryptochrome/photolyase family protein [Micromonospora echinofusca]
MIRRWLLADQLGPHFLDDPHQPVLLVEVKELFRRRVLHRQKAHLILSAIRHRAAELGDRAVHLRTGTFREALDRVGEPVEVCHPTTRDTLRFARSADAVTVLPPRGFLVAHRDFADWADRRHGALRAADFHRWALTHLGLATGETPARPGRAGSPASARRLDLPPPPPVREDAIDAGVRRDLDAWAAEGIRFVGRDAPRRYPATHAEAEERLQHFLTHRLAHYGRFRHVSLAADPVLAHSLLSSSFNLGLLDPADAIRRARQAHRTGSVPRASAEAFVRQLLGWREFLWQLYWYFEPGFRGTGRLAATRPVPQWFADLDADAVGARCLADALAGVRDQAWAPQIQRLMVLGSYGLQRGWRPAELADWFQRCFVDGTWWVMNAAVVGLSQYADLGRVDTRAYTSDGGYLDRIGDHCGRCRYDPGQRLGDRACPYTGGYESFLHRNRDRLVGDPGMAGPLDRLAGLGDREAVLAQEEKRLLDPP